MGQITEQQVMESLKAVIEPGRGADIVSRQMDSGRVIKDGNVGFVIEVDPRDGAKMEPLREHAEKIVHALPGVVSVTAVLTAHSAAGQGAPQAGPAPQQPPQAAEAPGAKPMVPGAAVVIWMTGAKQGVARVESAGWCEGKSGSSDAQAHTLAVESVSRLAPDSTQAARQYR